VPYTNLPYVLNGGVGCGQNLVNAGAAGRLDGVTIALGHEIEEAVTDPGAEDHIGPVSLGGWYDAFDANENGDKCAYVGALPLTNTPLNVPGAAGNIVGNRGGVFPVQSLWSNEAAAGVGYCAGTGHALPF
jgi:serine protease